jgi:hypothetical protein
LEDNININNLIQQYIFLSILGNYADDTQNGLIYSYFKLSRPKHTIVMGWKMRNGEK